MFTECPACETTFRLSAEDLRRAQGRVRCGECGKVFNALESLAEDTTTAAAGGAGNELPTPEPEWLTDSSNNPPGELDPDLDTYEAKGYIDPADAPEQEQVHAVDADAVDAEVEVDEQDDNGAAVAAPPDSTLDDEDAALEAALDGLADDVGDVATDAADTTLEADDEPATVYEFDEDDDDAAGIIVYLEPDEPDAPSEYATLAGLSGLGALAEDGPSDLDEHSPDPALSDASGDESTDNTLDDSKHNVTDITDSADATPDFDESIWERIPGVGADLHDDEQDPQGDGADDRADWLTEVDASNDDSINDLSAAAGEDWQVETSARAYAGADDGANDDTNSGADDAAEPENASAAAALSLEDDSAGANDDENNDENEDAGTDDRSGIHYGFALPTDADRASATSAAADDDEPAADAADELEFDVPAEKWNTFFGPMQDNGDAKVWQPPSLDAAASDAATDMDAEHEADLPDDVEGMPSWHGDVAATAAAEPPTSRAGLMLGGGLLLALLFTLQLLHYNRDDLAAHPRYGAYVRDTYAALDQPLYPSWSLQDNYEIRGSEAVAGESGQDVLDIRAQIAAVGSNPTGLPRLRVVLRDRWSNPVAASDFSATDYAQAADLPANGLLAPGTVIAAHISILDPGADAQGFELELCLPRRDTGLECTDQPFK